MSALTQIRIQVVFGDTAGLAILAHHVDLVEFFWMLNEVLSVQPYIRRSRFVSGDALQVVLGERFLEPAVIKQPFGAFVGMLIRNGE